MVSPLIYDINTYVKENLPAPYTDIEIVPLLGYSDTTPPYIAYQWLPSKLEQDRYYMLRDIIVYNIYDNNVDRMETLTEELKTLINQMDEIQGSVSSSGNRVLWSEWRGGTEMPPLERDGWYKTIFEFWIGYVPLS